MDSLYNGISSLLISKFIRYRLHFFLWSVYIVYESVIIGLISGVFGNLENYIIHYTLNITVFYLHSSLMERANLTGHVLHYFILLLIVLIEMVCYVLSLATLNHLFTIYNQANKYNILGIDYNFILRAVYRCLFFIILGSGYWSLKKYISERQKTEELEKQKLHSIIDQEKMSKALVQSEKAYMRAQINPHFLFNTLSFVQHRVQKADEDAGELLLSLAKMMRYTVGLDQTEVFTSLSGEVEQVENLINLFQIKENRSLSIHLDYDDSVLEQKMIPLVLLTLSENVIKHGVLNDPSFPASITISCSGDYIRILTENKTGEAANVLSSKTGLKNLSERLKQNYGDSYTFIYEENGGIFRADLSTPKFV
jgi:two-component system LytT family sensor kinase